MSNPFSDPSERLDSNPFEDPTISSALQSNRHEYGDEEASISSTPKAGNSTYTLPEPTGAPDLTSRFDDLARREQELNMRENALKSQAEHIRKHGRNNWPPGPFPLIFHDIEGEIPEAHRSTVLTLYRIWMFLILVLCVNLVGAILLLISGATNGGADLGAAIMYLPVIGILSFLTWYRPVYSAFMKDYSVFYLIYFVFAGFHLAFCTYMFIGIPSSGSAGLLNLIFSFGGGHIVAGIFCVLSTVGWALEGLASLWMYKNVWAHSHGQQGHTFAQAKAEVAMYGFKAYVFGGAKNEIPVSTA